MAAAIPTSAFLSAVRSQSNPLLSTPTAFDLPKTPILGPSNLGLAVAKPSIRIASLSSRNRLQVHCQEKKVAIVPREKRWICEESEINGPDIWNKTWYPKAAADHITTEKNKVNAEKVVVSGKKRTQKLSRSYSGRPGGMKVETFDQLQKRIPERIIEHAGRGMLPKGRVPTAPKIMFPIRIWKIYRLRETQKLS